MLATKCRKRFVKVKQRNYDQMKKKVRLKNTLPGLVVYEFVVELLSLL